MIRAPLSPAPLAPAPLSLSDLCCCQRLALWTIRCLSSGYRLPYCPETRMTDGLFPAAFRPVLDSAQAAFGTVAAQLAASGRPDLRIGPPGAQSVSAQEGRFIAIIAAAQNEAAEAAGEISALFTGLLPRGTSPQAGEALRAALGMIADCLAGAGHWLPQEGRDSCGHPPVKIWDTGLPEDSWRASWSREALPATARLAAAQM